MDCGGDAVVAVRPQPFDAGKLGKPARGTASGQDGNNTCGHRPCRGVGETTRELGVRGGGGDAVEDGDAGQEQDAEEPTTGISTSLKFLTIYFSVV